MKDLYAKLDIEPTAGEDEIAATLEQQPELAALGAVLLDPQKRAVYDGTYSTLRTIGALRHRLGLDKEASWFLDAHPDFAPSLKSVGKTRQASPARLETPPEISNTAATAGQKSSSIKGLAGALLVVAALAALYLLLR